jgi:cobalt/nickel transport system permease protein
MNALHSLPSSEAKNTFWIQLDARVKLLFCLAMLFLVLVNRGGYFPWLVTAWCWLVLALCGVPLERVLQRLAFPLFIALLVFLLKLLTHGNTPLFAVFWFNNKITAYHEGFSQGIMIAQRVLGGASLVLFLTLTTPVPQLINATKWLRLPHLLIELATLSYSYIFLFHETAVSIAEAQRVRLGYAGFWRSLRSLSSLIGSIFIQAYDQTQRTYSAMLVRGYSGQICWPCEAVSRKKSAADAAILSLWAAGLYALALVMGVTF